MPYKDIAKELTILLIFAVVAAFAVNFFSPKGIALIGEWETGLGVITAKAKDKVVDHELEIQDVRVAKEIFDNKHAVFVDARAYEDFIDGHIKGAVSLPINQFEDRIAQFKRDYPFTTYIVAYCSGRECDDSHELTQFLFEEGFTNISVYIDGYPAWEKEGYPIETVKPTGSLSLWFSRYSIKE